MFPARSFPVGNLTCKRYTGTFYGYFIFILANFLEGIFRLVENQVSSSVFYLYLAIDGYVASFGGRGSGVVYHTCLCFTTSISDSTWATRGSGVMYHTCLRFTTSISDAAYVSEARATAVTRTLRSRLSALLGVVLMRFRCP